MHIIATSTKFIYYNKSFVHIREIQRRKKSKLYICYKVAKNAPRGVFLIVRDSLDAEALVSAVGTGQAAGIRRVG